MITVVNPMNEPAESDCLEMLFLDEVEEDGNTDIEMLKFDWMDGDEESRSDMGTVAVSCPLATVVPDSREDEVARVQIRGMRDLPEPSLLAAGKGIEKQNSDHNDKWSLRRVDQLRQQLGHDMSTAFGNLPLKQVDELLSNLFARVVKANGKQYPASSLVNMMNGFNRILRRSSDIRQLKEEPGEVLDRSFNIKTHRNFTKTRLVLNAAIKKGGREGVNKRTKKVCEITEEQERAIFMDIDHQITHNVGCQKRLAAYLMLRIGVRGGLELWNLRRMDIEICVDPKGREYVQFEERKSKNNQWSIDRCKEHQFRKLYYSFEPDFVLTVKQYYRHLAPLTEEGVVEDLFTTPNSKPATIVWYNKKHKVSQSTSGKWLSDMLRAVGLPADLFSNKSGRTTLITRMAARGVPDDVGMMISGHHTLSGYSRYDRTQHLKQEAAILVSARGDLDYETALKEVTEKFKREQLEGNSLMLKPLVAPTTNISGNNTALVVGESSSAEVMTRDKMQMPMASTGQESKWHSVGSTSQVSTVQVGMKRQATESVDIAENPLKLARWHELYHGINWDDALQRDPVLARALGGGLGPRLSVHSVAGNTFSNMSHCTIQINVCHSPKQDFQKPTHGENNKENLNPENASSHSTEK